MSRTLTKKQKGFVADYVKTGNGSLAAKNNYDVVDDLTARVIASENLTKPNIITAIQDAFTDEDLEKAHRELLNQKRTEYFTFPKTMQDDEIEAKVNAAGLELLVIQDGEKGRYAFYAVIDAQARKSALDMAYKLKGSYAAEKTQSVHLNVDARIEDKDNLNAIREKFDNELKAKLISK